MVLYKDGEDQLDRSRETEHTTKSQGGKEYPAGGRQHRGCIIPQTVTHSTVPLKMGKIIARNMLS